MTGPRKPISLLLAVALALTSSCKREGWYRCHYRAVAATHDGKLGIPCVAQALNADEPNRGLLFIETQTKTGSPFHGWLRVVRPTEPGHIKVHLVLSCQGYADAANDFAWTLSPDTCKPGVEVGPLTVTAGTPKVWPGTGKSPVQENVDVP